MSAITYAVEHDVVKLKVTVQHTVLMQVPQAKANLGCELEKKEGEERKH